MRLIDADAIPYNYTNERGVPMTREIDIKNMPTIEPEQQWIPCSERLPEVGEDVLFSVGGVYVAEGCLREDGGWVQFRWNATQLKDVVGAWRRLPEPWEGERP